MFAGPMASLEYRDFRSRENGPTLATIKPSRRWGTQIVVVLSDMGHPAGGTHLCDLGCGTIESVVLLFIESKEEYGISAQH
jgi:hypothetical protein